MDVWRITLAALRRWYILVPLLALTGYGAMLAGNGVRPEYEVTATALITPGQLESDIPNPYGGLDDANTAVGIVLNSTTVRAQVASLGLISTYEVAAQSRSTIMYFTVRGDTPEIAVATGEAVFDLARTELETRQSAAGVPAGAQYQIDLLDPPAVLAVVYDGKVRIQAVVGLLGACIALLVAVLFDDIVGLFKRGRQRRRERRAELTPLEEPGSPAQVTGRSEAAQAKDAAEAPVGPGGEVSGGEVSEGERAGAEPAADPAGSEPAGAEHEPVSATRRT